MGRYLGKCKGVVGEIAVVGVRTRAMAAATRSGDDSSLPPAKKIKRAAAAPVKTPNTVHELRSRRRVAPAKEVENSASASPSCRPEVTTTTSQSDCVVVVEVASCCSSNNELSSSDMVKDRVEIVADPEQVESAQTRTSSRHLLCRNEAARREAESDDLDSPARYPDAKSTVQIKMPSDSEIEDFFATAEKDLQKRFTDKYNYDIVKDLPLEGRYEWVQVKP